MQTAAVWHLPFCSPIRPSQDYQILHGGIKATSPGTQAISTGSELELKPIDVSEKGMIPEQVTEYFSTYGSVMKQKRPARIATGCMVINTTPHRYYAEFENKAIAYEG